ncbi:MAG TPA: sigma-70 family RNA polymerase sigma factor [Thermoanaerobaculia bacterium]|nr:sigma-70 family RNA polymerase sigma factor [Thermoanaerobaculia bacterium]
MDVSPSLPLAHEEEALLADLRAGKDEAFSRLLRDHGGRLLAVSRRLLRNEEDARDAVQEAMVSAFRSLHRFEGGSRIATWLHRIVVNCCLMKLRSRQRRPEEAIEDLLPRFVEDGHQVEPSVDWAEPVDALLQRQEICALVRQCIDKLPESYRTVLLLRDIEELSTEEAARAVGVTENALKIRLHRARQALRTLLDPHLRGVHA